MPQPQAAPSFDAFISYHSGDAEWVAMLKRRLEERGIRLWLDSEQIRPGDMFPRTLARAIADVHCVVIVLSRGSLASSWVEEEYTLALTHRCRIIAVLVDDVEPPGFLGGRTWIDFRDAAAFETSLDQLVFGVTGERGAGAASAPVPEYRGAVDASTGPDEAEVLKRLIERSRENAKPLRRARVASGLIGAAIGGVFLLIGAEASLVARVAVCILAPLILSLAAWGVTATGVTRINTKVQQFELLRDGLEACRSRSHPRCNRLRQHVWDMLLRNAADLSGQPI